MSQANKELLLVLRLFSAVFLLIVTLGTGNVSAQDGEALFRGNCASCHMVDKDMTGPALKGVTARWEGKEELLHRWIKNPSDVAQSGDPYVRSLLNEWQPRSGLMTAQAVTDEDIDAILEYVENYQPPVDVAQTTGEGVETGASSGDSLTGVWLLIILFILLVVVFSLMGVRNTLSSLDDNLREKEGLMVQPKLTGTAKYKAWLWENKGFASVVGILVVVVLSVNAYEALMGIGVYEGYKPDQPIEFNHTLHAGEMQISCVYCHNGALKGKHAGIPATNICMNCHKAINEGRTPEGTSDIQKIYAAVGWDPDSQTYSGEENPIEWVKVHNLPDFAYFNHSQHYVVGQIECQECHGEVQQDFGVAEQFAPLTMGWCVNCHNSTQVQMQDNGYYDEIHARLVENGKEELKKYLEDGAITARELGGWECAKCHY